MLALSAGVAMGGAARAQDAAYEQLRKLHEDALKQLEIAQKRRNELDQELTALRERLAATEESLRRATGELETLRRQASEWAERTYFYRSFYAAWRRFVSQYPRLRTAWEAYLENRIPDVEDRLVDLPSLGWPFDPPPPPIPIPATTDGATNPATTGTASP